MNKFATNIKRQRLLIEGFYCIDVSDHTIREFFQGITKHLSLKVYGEPIIFSPSGEGKEENQGYDAFIPLIDSGISLYVWTSSKFVSLIIYTCKDFDTQEALKYTQTFFKFSEHISTEF